MIEIHRPGRLPHQPEPQRTPAVDFVGVTVVYGERQRLAAVDGFSLSIQRGEFVSIIGPSGCGKTTLLRCTAGLVVPTTGQIQVDGASVEDARRRRRIGFVFQRPALLPWRTVIRNVELPLELAGVPPDVRTQRAHEALDLVDLTFAAGRYPYELSGGMQQRVALAAALVAEPEVLLMDEPFAALDAITRDRLNVELLRIFNTTRITIVFVTHSIQEAILLSDRVVIMSARPGRILEVLTVPFGRPRNLDVRGDPAFAGLISQGLHLLERGLRNEVGRP